MPSHSLDVLANALESLMAVSGETLAVIGLLSGYPLVGSELMRQNHFFLSHSLRFKTAGTY